MKKKAMISQPMAGRDDEEIAVQREKAKRFLESHGYAFVDTWFAKQWRERDNGKSDEVSNVAVYFLSRSIERMSYCNAVYFCKGWENARGCRIEHAVAEAYGLEILYEE